MDHAFEVAVSPLVFAFFGGFLAAILIACASIPCLIAMPFLGWRRAVQLFLRAAMFIVLLHVLSLPANTLMIGVARDRLYYSADPILDFLPYLPFADVDPACGGHFLGFSEWTYGAVWTALAIPVWLGTIVAFRALLRGNFGKVLPT